MTQADNQPHDNQYDETYLRGKPHRTDGADNQPYVKRPRRVVPDTPESKARDQAALAELAANQPYVFLAHVTGNRPHYANIWRGPYQSAATAKAQITRMTLDWRGDPHGDWVGEVIRLDRGSMTIEVVA